MVVLRQETAEFCLELLRSLSEIKALKSESGKAELKQHVRALDQAIGNYYEDEDEDKK
jgi:hypothetical protein